MQIQFRALVVAASLLFTAPAAIAQSSMLSRTRPQSFADFLATRGLSAVAAFPNDPDAMFEVYTPRERAMQEGQNPITERVGFGMHIEKGKCKKPCWFVEMGDDQVLVDNSSLPKEEVTHWNATHTNSIMSNSGHLSLSVDIPLVNGRIDPATFDKHLLAWLTDFDEFIRKYYRPDPGITRWSFMRVRVEPPSSYVAAYMQSLKSK